VAASDLEAIEASFAPVDVEASKRDRSRVRPTATAMSTEAVGW